MKDQSIKNAPSKRKRRILCIVLAVILLLAGGAGVYVADYYHAEPDALAIAAEGVPGVRAEQESDRIVFMPEAPDVPKAGVIFYPGGKVEYSAYAPLLAGLAKEGYLCILLKMPLNLAVLDMDAAHGIPKQYPSVTRWALAGHSLGGSMAASCTAKHPEEFNALLLLAAYSTADLTESGLEVLSIYGSEDGVLNHEKYEKYRAKLPTGTREVVIEGGCHAGFGAYGPQDGDGTPAISRDEQISRTVREIIFFLQ